MQGFKNDTESKGKAFYDGMKAVEEKYKDFFESREGKHEEDEHDKLDYHWMIRGNADRTLFNFTKDSDLPKHIQNECIKVFNDAYGVKASKE